MIRHGGTQQTFTCSKSIVGILENGVKRYAICSKLTINTLERRRRDFIVNLEHISHLFLVFTIVHYKQINVCRGVFSCVNIIN